MDLLEHTLAAGVLSVAASAGIAWWVMPEDVRQAIRRWWGTFR